MEFFIKSKCFSAVIHISFSNVSRKAQPSQCNWSISAQGTGLGPSRTMSDFPLTITDLQHIRVSLWTRDANLQRAF